LETAGSPVGTIEERGAFHSLALSRDRASSSLDSFKCDLSHGGTVDWA
jgi:hypothetical protein